MIFLLSEILRHFDITQLVDLSISPVPLHKTSAKHIVTGIKTKHLKNKANSTSLTVLLMNVVN